LNSEDFSESQKPQAEACATGASQNTGLT